MPHSLNLTHCTLTGVDEAADLERVAALSSHFPLAEWGFLYSPKRQPGRYPAIATLAHAFKSLPPHVGVAMHVCGDGVPNLIAGHTVERRLLELVAARRGRVQLNFNQQRKPIDLDALAALLAAYPATCFITQGNAANRGVWQSIAQRGALNQAVLFDSSGGQGVSCGEWPRPLPITCGYAGGLGPENIAIELGRIARVAGAMATWVDMEGKLRRSDETGADWLDLDACEACLRAAHVVAW